MSSGKAKVFKKQDADKAFAQPESNKPDEYQAIAQPELSNNFTAELKSMFNDFYVQIQQDQEANRLQFTELRTAIDALNKQSPKNSPNLMDETQTPIPNRFEPNRRSTIFFCGSTPPYNKLASNAHPQIQILQNDIVYKNELTVSSPIFIGFSIFIQANATVGLYVSKPRNQDVPHGFLQSQTTRRSQLEFVLFQTNAIYRNGI